MNIHPARAANLLVSGYSYVRSNVTGNAEVKGMPLALGMELSAYCNLSCPECAVGSGKMTRQGGFMELSLFEKTIRELSPFLFNVNLYFQGESMMHPRFFSFLEAANGIHSTISTNGHFINENNARRLIRSGPGKIIISLDGADSETYLTYRRGGDFDKVMNGIRALAEERKKYRSGKKVELQFIVGSHNEQQTSGMKVLAASLGLPIRFKSMQVLEKSDIQQWMPENRSFRRYRLREEQWSTDSRLPDRCPRAWFNPVVTWDGSVLPCCFDKNADHVMGNLYSDTFREIWDGPKFRTFRKSILTGREMIEMCRNCTSGLRIRH